MHQREEAMSNGTTWQEDARFVGVFLRGGSWEIGLRIARRVTVGEGNGRPSKTSPIGEVSGRVGAIAFAREANISEHTVRRYLAAWEWASSDGLVDAAADLNPDDEYDFDEAGLHEDEWRQYYQTAVDNPPPWNPSAKPMIDQTRHVNTAVVKEAIKNNPELISEAIESDPSVRLAAREAISQADKNRKPIVDPGGKQDSPMEQLSTLHLQLRSAKRTLAEALGSVIDLRGVTDTDEIRAAVSGYLTQIRHVLDLIEEAAQGTSLDDELQQLLAEEDMR
jgi:hypothetical protein